MAKIVAAIIISVLLAAAGGYYYLYPPMVLKRATQQALNDLSKTVESRDRAKIAMNFNTLLTDNATIHLEVNFLSITGKNAVPAMADDFNKPSFITFIDNTLYSLSDYGYTAKLQDFVLSPDKKTAEVKLMSQEWADGLSYYGGMGVNTRFSSDTLCEGEVVFEDKRALLQKAVCKMQLRITPKTEQEHTLPTP